MSICLIFSLKNLLPPPPLTQFLGFCQEFYAIYSPKSTCLDALDEHLIDISCFDSILLYASIHQHYACLASPQQDKFFVNSPYLTLSQCNDCDIEPICVHIQHVYTSLLLLFLHHRRLSVAMLGLLVSQALSYCYLKLSGDWSC